jgi:hypothetical protein
MRSNPAESLGGGKNDAARHDGSADPMGVAQGQNLLRLRRWAIFTGCQMPD